MRVSFNLKVLPFQGLCSCSCCRPPPPCSPYQARPWKIGRSYLATISCQQPTYLSLVLNVHFARPNKSKLVSVCSRMIGGRQQCIGMQFLSHTEPKTIIYGGALRCTLYITQRARAISSVAMQFIASRTKPKLSSVICDGMLHNQ